MQQATVLGDIYIALDRPPSDGQPSSVLSLGSRIPKSQTSSPPQLEETIANLANFVSSGSIQRVQNTIIGINGATPSGDGAVRKIAGRFATDMSDLSGNLDQVDLLLNSTSQTAQIARDRIPSYQNWFSPAGVRGFKQIFFMTGYVSVLLPTLGSIYSGGFWLVPFLNSTADAAGAIRTSKRAFESEVHQWRRLFTDEFLPQDKYPAINITSIVGPDGRELSHNVGDVLRILGAMP
jgi:phospholipid/cholesterol/gamma-HCH transport system substrate-binding protein